MINTTQSSFLRLTFSKVIYLLETSKKKFTARYWKPRTLSLF